MRVALCPPGVSGGGELGLLLAQGVGRAALGRGGVGLFLSGGGVCGDVQSSACGGADGSDRGDAVER